MSELWQAVALAPDGWLIPAGELDHFEPEDVRIEIVTGTAAPVDPDGAGIFRIPDTFRRLDRIEAVREYDCESTGEVESRWIQAQAMAAGLNAATLRHAEVNS